MTKQEALAAIEDSWSALIVGAPWMSDALRVAVEALREEPKKAECGCNCAKPTDSETAKTMDGSNVSEVSDLISRQATLEALSTWDKFGVDERCRVVRWHEGLEPYVHLRDVVIAISNLPSEEPDLESAYAEGYTAAESKYRAMMDSQTERKGKWIEVEVFPESYDIYGFNTWSSEMQCNQCGFRHTAIEGHMAQYNYCPNCGADMRGGTE